MAAGRVWIGVIVGAVTALGLYQGIVLPRQVQEQALAAAQAARLAEARARAASEAARRASGAVQGREGPADVILPPGDVSR